MEGGIFFATEHEISVGKQREFWERRWSSPLAGFLAGSHIILIKCLKLFDSCLKLFDGQVSLGSGCANV